MCGAQFALSALSLSLSLSLSPSLAPFSTSQQERTKVNEGYDMKWEIQWTPGGATLGHVGVGMASGVFEVLMQQPTIAWKNALQEGRPIPRNPVHWYRGVLLSAASIAPVTGLQFGTKNVVLQTLRRLDGFSTAAGSGPPPSTHTLMAATLGSGGGGREGGVCKGRRKNGS